MARWYLEILALVVVCFALGAVLAAVLMQARLPEAPPDREPVEPVDRSSAP